MVVGVCGGYRARSSEARAERSGVVVGVCGGIRAVSSVARQSGVILLRSSAGIKHFMRTGR